MSATFITPSEQLLWLAQQAEERGDRRKAHELCVHLTQVEPANETAWLRRAATAESSDETLTALSAILAQDSTNTVARQTLSRLMEARLRNDAFIGYIAETDQTYQIHLLPDLTITHPKDRDAAEPYPPVRSAPLAAALRWLGWSILGLIPAGLGTLIGAPIAMFNAAKVLRAHPDAADRQRARVVLSLAIGLWCGALFLTFIFLLHLS